MKKTNKTPTRTNSTNVNTAFINKWIDDHVPAGLERLAKKLKTSPTTIHNLRHGIAPKTELLREKLCDGLNVKTSFLFPEGRRPTNSRHC